MEYLSYRNICPGKHVSLPFDREINWVIRQTKREERSELISQSFISMLNFSLKNIRRKQYSGLYAYIFNFMINSHQYINKKVKHHLCIPSALGTFGKLHWVMAKYDVRGRWLLIYLQIFSLKVMGPSSVECLA